MTRAANLFATMLLATITSAVASDYLTYSGTAKAPHRDDVLYGEHHVLRFDGGRLQERVVLYTCHDGSAFARKRITYRDLLAPDFELEDTATHYREGVRSDAGRRVVFFKSATGSEQKAALPQVEELVADAGFDEFVKKHWAELLTNTPVRFDFLVPSTLGDHRFQVDHLRTDGSSGRPLEVFRLRLAGWWGRLLPTIDVYYDAKDRVLTRYDGLSNLRAPGGSNMKADIHFPLQARQPVTDAAWQAALGAPLASCRSPS